MRFLLDENVSRTLHRGLLHASFSVLSVEEAGLRNAADDEIIAFAKRKRLVIITHDKDFGNLIRFPLQVHEGVILLRFRNQRPLNVLPHLLHFLATRRNMKSRLAVLSESGFRIVK